MIFFFFVLSLPLTDLCTFLPSCQHYTVWGFRIFQARGDFFCYIVPSSSASRKSKGHCTSLVDQNTIHLSIIDSAFRNYNKVWRLSLFLKGNLPVSIYDSSQSTPWFTSSISKYWKRSSPMLVEPSQDRQGHPWEHIKQTVTSCETSGSVEPLMNNWERATCYCYSVCLNLHF